MDIYVGNLPFSVEDGELNEIFAEHGAVESARVLTDRDTGRSRGFGFVKMANEEDAENAIEALNGSEVDGRPLKVRKAEPRPEGGGGGGGFRGRGGDRGGDRGGFRQRRSYN